MLCTAALFLSGYTIQQRTLRDLRAAIKAPAQPSPKIFLPDRFAQETTELEDGTVVPVDHVDDKALSLVTSGTVAESQQEVIEVSTTALQSGDEQSTSESVEPTQQNKEESEEPLEEKLSSARLDEIKIAPTPPQSPSPEMYEGSGAANQKPISRAERRRRIKEEIQRLSHINTPMYYQRRLW